MTTLLLFFYGLCAWGAGCNLPAWARLFWRRVREGGSLAGDVYIAVRAGILLSALGTLGLAGDRVSAALAGRVTLAVPSPVGLVSIALMALAEVLFLHAAAINARGRNTTAWAWRIYWVGASLWTLGVLLIG